LRLRRRAREAGVGLVVFVEVELGVCVVFVFLVGRVFEVVVGAGLDGVAGPLFHAPAHLTGGFVEALGLFPKGLVEGEVAEDHLVLIAQVALPIKFVPDEVSAIFPFVIRRVFGIGIAHGKTGSATPAGKLLRSGANATGKTSATTVGGLGGAPAGFRGVTG
jgi:hypothetical protein